MPRKEKVATAHVSFRTTPVLKARYAKALEYEGLDSTTFLHSKMLELVEKYEKLHPDIFREISEEVMKETGEEK
jgi:hypothetical protein